MQFCIFCILRVFADSRAPRASRSTRGTTRPARRSAQQEYCDMLHNARDSTEKLAPVAHQRGVRVNKNSECGAKGKT